MDTNKVLERKIEVFEMWCLRKMGKFKRSDLISNEKVLKTANKKITLGRHPAKKIKKLRAHQKERRYSNSRIRRKNARQTSTR